MTAADQSVSFTRRWRLLFALAITLVVGLGLGLGVTGVSASSTSNRSGGAFARASFPRYGVSLRYPSLWARMNWCWTGVNVIPIALLTTASPKPVCTKPAVGVGASFPPAERLGTNGVSVELALQAVFAGAKTRWNARIGGQPANVARPVFGNRYHGAVTCPSGVRREYRAVAIERPAAMNELVTVDAVICGPHLAGGDSALDRVLHSISFKRLAARLGRCSGITPESVVGLGEPQRGSEHADLHPGLLV